MFHLTDAGRGYVEARQEEFTAPWETMAESVDERAAGMRELMGQVGMAFIQVTMAGSEAQMAEARRVLINARKALYRILAEDDDTTGSGDPA